MFVVSDKLIRMETDVDDYHENIGCSIFVGPQIILDGHRFLEWLLYEHTIKQTHLYGTV